MANGPPSGRGPTGPPTPRTGGGWRPGWLTDRVVYVMCGVVVVVLIAEGVLWASSSNETSLAPPGDVAVERAERQRPSATVSFDPVSEAEAYLVEPSGEAADAIRVEPEDCSESRCHLTFDWLTAAGASSLTVRAMAGDEMSERSEDVELPDWPSPDQEADDEPVVLVVTREGAGGQPAVETETVEPGEDLAERVEARITELEAAEGVVGVDIQALSLEPAQQPGDPEPPEGIATWQEWAWTFDSLPSEPRGSGVTVGVIDVGIDADHPAFQDADISVVNVADPGMGVEPDDHGTEVTSVIAGQPGGRVPGIAPGAAIRFYGGIDVPYDPAFDDDSIARHGKAGRMAAAIRQAVDDGVQVIVTSALLRCTEVQIPGPIPNPGVLCPDEAIDPAVQYAEDNGVVVVAAAGNDADHELCTWGSRGPLEPRKPVNATWWPSKLDTVIAVGGVNQDGTRWLCSPDKDYIDVLAPSRRLRVATGSDGYAVESGTSYAAPLVAGLVATILAERPDLVTPGQVRDLLQEAIVDDEGRQDPAEHGQLIPLYALRELGMLDDSTGGVVAGQRDLFARELVTDDVVWPRLEETALVTLDANPDGGTASSALTEVLGEPAVTEPASWRGSSGGDEGPPEPRTESDISPPECWSSLYGMMLWGEGTSPVFGVLYAREELPEESGDPVPAGAVLGYRAYRPGDMVRMADGVEIGQTQVELEEAYVDTDGRPYREVQFLDEGDGEFELVDVDAPSGGGGGRETIGSPGPNLGQMSSESDPATDTTIVERGAGFDCGLEDVGALFAAGCASGSGGEGCGTSEPPPDDSTEPEPGPDDSDGPGQGGGGGGHEMEITLEGAPDDLYMTVWGPSNYTTYESSPSCDGQPNSHRFYWEPGTVEPTGSSPYDLQVFNWHCDQMSGDPGSVLSFTINITVDGQPLEPVSGSVAPLQWWTHELELD